MDGKRLRELLELCSTAAAEGLPDPASQLLDPIAASVPPSRIKDGVVAITREANGYAVCWAALGCPSWPAATEVAAIAPVPARDGQGSGEISTLGGWALGINEASPNEELAWQLIDIRGAPRRSRCPARTRTQA